jgi:hypothetical protein
MRYAVLALGLSGLAGCVRASEGVVREQAAAAFACAEYALEVEEVGPDEYRASGCGQALIYTCHRAETVPHVSQHVSGQASDTEDATPEVGNAGPEEARVCTRRPE